MSKENNSTKNKPRQKPVPVANAISGASNYLKAGAGLTAGIVAMEELYNRAKAAEEKFGNVVLETDPVVNAQSFIPSAAVGTGMGMPYVGNLPDMSKSREIAREVLTDPSLYRDVAYGTVNTIGGSILDRQKENYQKWEGNPFGQWILSPLETVADTPYNVAKDLSDFAVGTVKEGYGLVKNTSQLIKEKTKTPEEKYREAEARYRARKAQQKE